MSLIPDDKELSPDNFRIGITSSHTNPERSQRVSYLSDLEAQILTVLWSQTGTASEGELLDGVLRGRREMQLVSITQGGLRTGLKRLLERGFVTANKEPGQRNLYTVRVTREQVAAWLMNNISQRILGKPLQGVLSRLVGTHKSHQKISDQEVTAEQSNNEIRHDSDQPDELAALIAALERI